MKLAICGFEGAGKSTVFDALTGQTGGVGSREPRLETVDVPDPRLERLRSDYSPKKFSPARVQYLDLPGFGGDRYIADLRDADTLLCVVRGFDNPSVLPRSGSVDWKRDIHDFEEELAIADFILAEKNVERLRRTTRHGAKREDLQRLEILTRLLPVLEEGRSPHELELKDEELALIRDYALLSLKPRLMVVNLDDEADIDELGLTDVEEPRGEEVSRSVVLALRARLESEVAQLEADEREEFLSDFGIGEMGAHRVLRISYSYLNLMSFFTAGDKEVRAWTIKRGSTAVEAAGKIHSDFARAFIRAEVTGWADYAELGSVKAVKDAKRWRLEAKAYLVCDGDIMEIRHGA